MVGELGGGGGESWDRVGVGIRGWSMKVMC